MLLNFFKLILIARNWKISIVFIFRLSLVIKFTNPPLSWSPIFLIKNANFLSSWLCFEETFSQIKPYAVFEKKIIIAEVVESYHRAFRSLARLQRLLSCSFKEHIPLGYIWYWCFVWIAE